MMSTAETSAPIHRPCPLCADDEPEPTLQKGELRLVRCRRCRMLYADPVDAELASGKFYDRMGVPFYLSPDKLEADYAPVRFERELRLFRSHCRGGAVLDVGCSTGAFLFQLKSRFPKDYAVTGMDVGGAALDHAASRGIEVIRESFLDHDFGARRFDAVTFWAVIEHLNQPKRFLARAAEIVKPGGRCFILVPNMRSLAARLLGRKYRYIMPDHVNYFTAETLRQFAAGEPAFEALTLGSSHFNPLVILQDFRGGREPVDAAERARLLKRTTAWKQNPLLTPAKWAYAGMEGLLRMARLADNLVIVLRKK